MRKKNKAPVRRMRVQDAFSNELARLGFDTPNLLEGTQYSMARIGRDFLMLNSLYREHWIVRRIIATIPEDMTKNWIKITSQVKPDLLRRFDLELRRTQLISKITKGLKWGRLYGGAVAVMLVKGQGDDLSQPLNVDAIMPGDFAGLAVFDRWNGVYPSGDLETNIEDPEFGLPKFYNVADPETGVNVRVHHSRCLRFIGNDLPYWEEIAEQYWGGSVIESVFDELKKRDNVSWNIAQLTFMANVRVMKMKDLGQLLSATDVNSQKELYQTLQAQNMLLSNMGVQVMDAEDGMESHQYTFGGLADCYKNFIMDICGAAEIPATRLFGRSPEGMNATGESDLQNYYEMITKNQESTLRPILNKLLPVLCMSILGAVPDDLDYEFNPVRQPSDEDLVDLAKAGTENVIQAYNAGLVSQRTALLELKQQSERTGIWTNITDADIEAANDQVEQPGEMGGDMAAMMGGEGGNPQGGPEQSNGGPSAGQETPRVPQAKTPEVKTPEVKTPNPGAKDSYPFSVKDDDEFESKHPRRDDGKFGKGNGPTKAVTNTETPKKDLPMGGRNAKVKVNPTGANKILARSFVSKERYDQHWSKHGGKKELAGLTKEQYLQEALNLLEQPISPGRNGIKGYVDAFGNLARYDPVKNLFVVGNPSGGIWSCYPLRGGRAQFEEMKRSVTRHGKKS